MSTKSPFLDTGTVAALLRYHPNTIREHLIPVSEWVEGSTEIPSVKLGGRYLIPRWWVERMIAAGTTPPRSEEDTEITEIASGSQQAPLPSPKRGGTNA